MYKHIAVGIAVALFVQISHAQPVAAEHGAMTNPAGRTLYIFDKDEHGKSNCNNDCSAMWPPFAAAQGAGATGDFSLLKRSDGTLQWAYKGKPLYTYVGDGKAGDALGDGRGGVWHVARIGTAKAAPTPSSAPAYGNPNY
jgi:predicted lipoprotein with Yx(FWY)xxD motif